LLLRSSGEGQQGDVARLLDGPRQTALVRRAYAGQAARSDLAALGDELRQQTHIFVIDRFDFFDAELANLLAPKELAPTFAGTTGASAGTPFPSFSAAFTVPATVPTRAASAISSTDVCA